MTRLSHRSARGTRAATAVLALALAGCVHTPTDPRSTVEPPEGWRTSADTKVALSERPWGDLFRGPQVEALILEALANNSDLRIAVERIEVARAQFGLARSALFPSLAADATYQRGRQPALIGTQNQIGESSTFGLAVPAWEIDLWGRLRDSTEAAQRQMFASEQTRRAVYIGLIAQVAQGYLGLIDLDTQIEVARRTIIARQESLRVVRARFEAGITSAADLRQAESAVAGAEAALYSLIRGRAQSENALSVLVGRNPGPIVRNDRLTDATLPPRLPAGLPSQLLERRPDVLAAEQQLRAADANISAARKAYFPSLSLTGFLGFASPALRDLFDSGRDAWSVSPAITLPIFNAGRIAANVEAAEAQQRITIEQYRKTVRTAFREVDDALVAYQQNLEVRDAVARVVVANRERERLAQLRYRNGITIYVEVLLAQQQTFEAELQLSQSVRAVYEAVISLYAALGGGWNGPGDGDDGGAKAPAATPGTSVSANQPR